MKLSGKGGIDYIIKFEKRILQKSWRIYTYKGRWGQFINILEIQSQKTGFTPKEDMEVSEYRATQLKGLFKDDEFFRSMYDG